MSKMMRSLLIQNGVPQDLTISTAEWLAQNGYQALPVVFNEGMVAYGYGDLRQVPIVGCSMVFRFIKR